MNRKESVIIGLLCLILSGVILMQINAPKVLSEDFVKNAETAQSRYEDPVLDINTATKEQLGLLEGIGDVLAERIVNYRNAYGLFSSVEDLLQIEGINTTKLEKIRKNIVVVLR